MDFLVKETIEGAGYQFRIDKDTTIFVQSLPEKALHWKIKEKNVKMVTNWYKIFGVFEGKLYFQQQEEVNTVFRAEHSDDDIVVAELFEIEENVKFLFIDELTHYFIEKEGKSCAIPINEDYRTSEGIQLAISIDELATATGIAVYEEMLFIGSNKDKGKSKGYIRRYVKDSEYFDEVNELPDFPPSSKCYVCNNIIFYFSLKNSLVSIDANTLAVKVFQTNLAKGCRFVELSENELLIVQSDPALSPVKLMKMRFVENVFKRAELAKKVEELEQQRRQESAKCKELEKQLKKNETEAKMEMDSLKEKYARVLILIGKWKSAT